MPVDRTLGGLQNESAESDLVPQREVPLSILLVCTANVSRSPTAQLLFESITRGEKSLRFESAGTRAAADVPIDPEMQRRLQNRVASPLSFVSQALTSDLVSSVDLILGMTRQHCSAAVQLVPSAVRSTFTLEEFAGLLGNIPRLEENHWTSPGERLRVAMTLAEGRRVPYRLSAERDDDIPDPIGRSASVYNRTFERIFSAVKTISDYAAPAAPS